MRAEEVSPDGYLIQAETKDVPLVCKFQVFEVAEPENVLVLEGTWKWDGCVDFHTENFHICESESGAQLLSNLWEALRGIVTRLMPHYADTEGWGRDLLEEKS